ncbi:MAG: lipid-A-disaccharide synthase [Pseudomonas fluorescens]|nr:MAG: lipid-A-disaccharide synthase [Pseudomonas fluorescens]
MPKGATRTILISAGEASGDRLGGALMAEIRAQHPEVRFIGVGGPHMQIQGLKPLFPMSDLAVMGLFEVIPAIPRILGRLTQLTALARAEKPDLIISIDSQDFSSRLAKRLKPLGIPHIQYVAPKVWAWRQHRVKKLKSLYTHLLTILPFETDFFARAGMSASYVGHPSVTLLKPYLQGAKTETKDPVLAILPGSRTAELKQHWPLFLQTYRQLRMAIPNLSAVLALPSEKALTTCHQLADWTKNDAIKPIFGEDRFTHLATATAALSKSGTNNLELALLYTPAVVSYRMNGLTYAIAKRLVKVPYISLPNLILHYAGQGAVYPEFIQHDATPDILAAELALLLTNAAEAKTQRSALQRFHALMDTPKPPAAMAVDVISKYMK